MSVNSRDFHFFREQKPFIPFGIKCLMAVVHSQAAFPVPTPPPSQGQENALEKLWKALEWKEESRAPEPLQLKEERRFGSHLGRD